MSSIVKSAIFVSLAGLAVSFANMLSHLVMARTFGAGAEIDAFFIGLSLPLLVGGLLTAAVGYQVVPMLVHFRGDGCTPYEYRNALLFSGLAVGFAIAVVGSAISWWMLRHFPNAAALEVHHVNLIALTGWAAACASLLTALLVAFCQAQHQFTRPVLLGVIAPLLSIIASRWAATRGYSVLLVACALLVGQCCNALLLLYRLRKEIALGIPRPAAWVRVGRDLRGAPLILASMLTFTCFGSIDGYFAGRLDAGAVTCLAYAQRILVALAGLAVNGVGVVMLPALSRSAADGDKRKMLAGMSVTLRTVALVLSPIAMVGALLAEPATRFLFGGGKFDQEAVARLSGVLPYLFAGTVPMSCATMLFKGLYALQDNRGAAMIGLAGAGAYLAGCATFSLLGYGVNSFGVSYIICALLVFTLSSARFARQVPVPVSLWAPLSWSTRLFAALLVVATVTIVGRHLSAFSPLQARMITGIRLAEIVGLVTTVYLLMCYLFKMEEVIYLVRPLLARLRGSGGPQVRLEPDA
jgi:putative peptidoglycan lipid II flippase